MICTGIVTKVGDRIGTLPDKKDHTPTRVLLSVRQLADGWCLGGITLQRHYQAIILGRKEGKMGRRLKEMTSSDIHSLYSSTSSIVYLSLSRPKCIPYPARIRCKPPAAISEVR